MYIVAVVGGSGAAGVAVAAWALVLFPVVSVTVEVVAAGDSGNDNGSDDMIAAAASSRLPTFHLFWSNKHKSHPTAALTRS